MTIPACFDSPEQYQRWQKLRRQGTICTDCTREYRRLMQEQGRCHPQPSRAETARRWLEEYGK